MKTVLPICLMLFACAAVFAEEGVKMTGIKGKKVVLVIGRQNFRDEEFQEPYERLRKAGADVKIACSSLKPAKGMLGKVVKPDILLGDVKASDCDCVVFVGGTGATEYFQDDIARGIAKAAADQNKVLGAICIAPAILANAGVLKGKNATAFPSVREDVTKGGGTYLSRDVVTDGNIITAVGPQAAGEFAETLIKAIEAACRKTAGK